MVCIVYAKPSIIQLLCNSCHPRAPGTSKCPGEVATSSTGLVKAELQTVIKPYKIA